MSGADVFVRAQAEYESRLAGAEALRRTAESQLLAEAQYRIDLTWRFLREGLERRADLFRRALDGVWSVEQLAEHLGLTVERVEAIAGYVRR